MFLVIAVMLLTAAIGVLSPTLHKPLVITSADFNLKRYSEPVKISHKPKPYKSLRDSKIEPSVFLTKDNTISTDYQSVKPAQAQTIKNSEPKYKKPVRKLTKKEEQIAWNVWRSNLQNEVMLRSEVSAPIGTVFIFSFKVDNSRHISNIKAYTTNPFYMSEVNENLIPVIKDLENSELLEFPAGSARKSIKFNGLFFIFNETSLSTPEDFNDIERVNVYE